MLTFTVLAKLKKRSHRDQMSLNKDAGTVDGPEVKSHKSLSHLVHTR